MLVQRPLRSVGPLAGVDGASIVALDFVGGPPEPFLSVIVAPLALLDFLPLLLEFGEFGGQLIALVDELAHLGKQDDIGEVGPTVLVVVVEVVIRIHRQIHIR